MQQNGRLIGDGTTPPHILGGLFPKSNSVYKMCHVNRFLYQLTVDSRVNLVSVQHQYILSVDDL